MSFTVADVIAEAQVYLSDRAGTRYLEADLIRYVRQGYHKAVTLRPDLLIYGYSDTAPTLATTGATVPLPDHVLEALSYYVAGRAELRDDEFAVDGRAMTFKQMLDSYLLKGAG